MVEGNEIANYALQSPDWIDKVFELLVIADNSNKANC
jgi:hypothetical protein